MKFRPGEGTSQERFNVRFIYAEIFCYYYCYFSAWPKVICRRFEVWGYITILYRNDYRKHAMHKQNKSTN